jgi:hypothetical protein
MSNTYVLPEDLAGLVKRLTRISLDPRWAPNLQACLPTTEAGTLKKCACGCWHSGNAARRFHARPPRLRFTAREDDVGSIQLRACRYSTEALGVGGLEHQDRDVSNEDMD